MSRPKTQHRDPCAKSRIRRDTDTIWCRLIVYWCELTPQPERARGIKGTRFALGFLLFFSLSFDQRLKMAHQEHTTEQVLPSDEEKYTKDDRYSEEASIVAPAAKLQRQLKNRRVETQTWPPKYLPPSDAFPQTRRHDKVLEFDVISHYHFINAVPS